MKKALESFAIFLFVLACCGSGRSDDAQTSLIIIGGGLRPDNAAIYQRLIDAAKVNGRSRIGIIPTASVDGIGAKRFAERLQAFSVK